MFVDASGSGSQRPLWLPHCFPDPSSSPNSGTLQIYKKIKTHKPQTSAPCELSVGSSLGPCMSCATCWVGHLLPRREEKNGQALRWCAG